MGKVPQEFLLKEEEEQEVTRILKRKKNVLMYT